jgi:hypothetical protein
MAEKRATSSGSIEDLGDDFCGAADMAAFLALEAGGAKRRFA